MKLILKQISKAKIVGLLIAVAVASFDGVVLSSIVAYAGKFTKNTSISVLLLFGFISLFCWILVYCSQYFTTIIGSSIIRDLNINLKQQHYWSCYTATDSTNDSATVISNLANDFKLVETQYFQPLISLIAESLLCIVSLIYMMHFNVFVSLFFIILSFLPTVTPILFSKRLSVRADKWSFANKTFIEKLKDFYQGMSVLKSYRRTSNIKGLVKNAVYSVEESSYELNKAQAEANLGTSILSGISFICPFVVGCFFIKYTNTLSFSTLIAIFLLNDRVVGPVQSIAENLNKIATTKQIRKKIFSNSSKYYNEVFFLGTQSKTLINKLVFSDVRYRINDNNLIEINLVLNTPMKILIYGDSGSGKTTILNLIRNQLKPDSGSICAYDEKNKLIKDFITNIAYISQNPYIFNTNIKNNVTLFDTSISDNRVTEVLKKVGLYGEFGKKNIVNYQCGNDGENLSGGQRQRIEIARSLIFEKSLYLADEITANLDEKNSRSVRTILMNLNAPVIEVAHHFDSNDRRYSAFYNLKDGKLKISFKNKRG